MTHDERNLRDLEVSTILRDYGGDTARTDESGRSNFGSEFSSGYAPRSARAVLRTLEQNEKLANRLIETQRALDLTTASLAKQKALNKRLEESSNQRRAELEAFSRIASKSTSAVLDTTDPFSDIDDSGGGFAGKEKFTHKKYMTGVHEEEIGGNEDRHEEVRARPGNVEGGLKKVSVGVSERVFIGTQLSNISTGELNFNARVQAPSPSKLYARNDETQIVSEERDEVKELGQELQFPCTDVAPPKSMCTFPKSTFLW